MQIQGGSRIARDPDKTTAGAHVDRDGQSSAPPAPCTIESATLFRGAREVRIAHAGTSYRLTITRLNKLILTK